MARALSTASTFIAVENRVDALEAAIASGVADGDKGDITVSSGGTVWTVTADIGGDYIASADYANVDTLITAVGSSELPVLMNDNKTVSSSKTFPANTRIIPGGGKFVKASVGQLEFEGNPFAEVSMERAIFEGFAAGDITFTGTGMNAPKRISAEWWNTGNNSYAERVNRADQSVVGKECQIVCYPRELTGTAANVSPYHHILNMPGHYLSTFVFGSPDKAPVILDDNTSFRSMPGAFIYESSSLSGINNQPIVVSKPMGTPFGEGAICYNIFVEDNYFIGDPSQLNTSGPSTVILGNVHNGGINRNTFDGTHGYNVIGGFGSSGNAADGWTMNDNKFYRPGTQPIAVINGRNGRIAGNYFNLKDSVVATAYTIIDLEPNIAEDVLENIVVENNIIYGIDETTFAWYGIIVNDVPKAGAKNITVRNNEIWGCDPLTGPFPNQLITGIVAGGVGIQVYGNKIYGPIHPGINLSSGRDMQCYDNWVHIAVDQTDLKQQIHVPAVASSVIRNNHVTRSALIAGTQKTGIYETENYKRVTTVGDTITELPGDPFSAVRFHDYMSGLAVVINNTEYELDTCNDIDEMTVTVSIGTIPQKTFVAADVNTTNNTIDYTSHPYNTGARAVLTNSGGALPAHTPPTTDAGTGVVFYYIIDDGANTIKLASSLANALAGTAIDLTDAGSGTSTISLVMKTKFSSNKFSGNEASDGITLEPTGTSQILSTFDDEKVVSVNDANYTIGKADGTIIVDSLSAARTLSLPAMEGLNGKQWRIKDGSGLARFFPITIDAAGSDLIDSQPNAVIDTSFGWATIKSRGTFANVMARSASAADAPAVDPPAGLTHVAHWWKASAIDYLADGAAVPVFPDLIGGANFGQTGSARPIWVANAGDPYIQLDGVDDSMAATIASLTDYILITVWERVSTIAGYARLFESSSLGILICQDSNTNGQLHFPNAATPLSRTTAAPPTGFMSLLAERIGSAGRFRINGSETTGTIATTASGTTLTLGKSASGEWANVRVKEIILCNDAFETGEEAALATYINDEYGLTL